MRFLCNELTESLIKKLNTVEDKVSLVYFVLSFLAYPDPENNGLLGFQNSFKAQYLTNRSC